jgi:hypothetical protein
MMIQKWRHIFIQQYKQNVHKNKKLKNKLHYSLKSSFIWENKKFHVIYTLSQIVRSGVFMTCWLIECSSYKHEKTGVDVAFQFCWVRRSNGRECWRLV